jgi:hypothetical protein
MRQTTKLRDNGMHRALMHYITHDDSILSSSIGVNISRRRAYAKTLHLSGYMLLSVFEGTRQHKKDPSFCLPSMKVTIRPVKPLGMN